MPQAVMSQLGRDAFEVNEYVIHWANCIDYAFGIGDLTKTKALNELTRQLLVSGDRETDTTVSLLLVEDRPNPRAIESARMATEMFLKAFLAAKAGLTRDDARLKIGHNLEKALERCALVDAQSELLTIGADLSIFPNIGDRYEGTDHALGILWRAYQVAQFTSATVVRSLTGRDVRKTLRVS